MKLQKVLETNNGRTSHKTRGNKKKSQCSSPMRIDGSSTWWNYGFILDQSSCLPSSVYDSNKRALLTCHEVLTAKSCFNLPHHLIIRFKVLFRYFCQKYGLYLDTEPLHALPQTRGMDGFFCAVMVRWCLGEMTSESTRIWQWKNLNFLKFFLWIFSWKML